MFLTLEPIFFVFCLFRVDFILFFHIESTNANKAIDSLREDVILVSSSG